MGGGGGAGYWSRMNHGAAAWEALHFVTGQKQLWSDVTCSSSYEDDKSWPTLKSAGFLIEQLLAPACCSGGLGKCASNFTICVNDTDLLDTKKCREESAHGPLFVTHTWDNVHHRPVAVPQGSLTWSTVKCTDSWQAEELGQAIQLGDYVGRVASHGCCGGVPGSVEALKRYKCAEVVNENGEGIGFLQRGNMCKVDSDLVRGARPKIFENPDDDLTCGVLSMHLMQKVVQGRGGGVNSDARWDDLDGTESWEERNETKHLQYYLSLVGYECCGGHGKARFTTAATICASDSDFRPRANFIIDKVRGGIKTIPCHYLAGMATEHPQTPPSSSHGEPNPFDWANPNICSSLRKAKPNKVFSPVAHRVASDGASCCGGLEKLKCAPDQTHNMCKNAGHFLPDAIAYPDGRATCSTMSIDALQFVPGGRMGWGEVHCRDLETAPGWRVSGEWETLLSRDKNITGNVTVVKWLRYLGANCCGSVENVRSDCATEDAAAAASGGTATVFAPKLIRIRLSVQMTVPADSTTESLNANANFTISLKTGIASMFNDASISRDDILNLRILLGTIFRELAAEPPGGSATTSRRLQAESALEIDYDLRVRSSGAEGSFLIYSAKPLSEQSALFVSGLTEALAGNDDLSGEFGGPILVTAVATEAPPPTTTSGAVRKESEVFLLPVVAGVVMLMGAFLGKGMYEEV